MLIRPVGVQHLAPKGAGPRVRIREGNQLFQRMIMNNCIGIQDEDVITLRRGDGCIVTPGKAKICPVVHHRDVAVAILLPDVLHRTVRRAVVRQ